MQQLNVDSIAFSFPSRKNITINNTITISDVHASWAKANIEEANALNHNKKQRLWLFMSSHYLCRMNV